MGAGRCKTRPVPPPDEAAFDDAERFGSFALALCAPDDCSPAFDASALSEFGESFFARSFVVGAAGAGVGAFDKEKLGGADLFVCVAADGCASVGALIEFSFFASDAAAAGAVLRFAYAKTATAHRMSSAAATPIAFARDGRESERKTAEFQDWCKAVSPQFVWDWDYQKLIYANLDRITEGATDRAMFFLPPRHSKTTTVTVHYPAWRLARDPRTRIILGAYKQKLANRFSRQVRRIVASQIPLSDKLSDKKKAQEEWETLEGGGVLAVGRGSGVTGYGADIIIIDDPIKSRLEAESESFRERIMDWFNADLYTRQEPGCAIILCNTRWRPDDLAGQLLSESEQGGDCWDVLSLPALAENDDPLGRQAGEPLCPARFDKEKLERIRARSSPYDWNSLYQQRPTPNEGAVFKVDWFKRIVPCAPPNLRWVRYWDLAVSTKNHADYTASAAVAFDKDGTLYIRDMVRGRWEYPDARRKMIDTMRAESRTIHGIEKALHGMAAVQELRRDPRILNVPFRGVPVTKDKLTRALAWAERAAEGKVALVQGGWINEFLKEVTVFSGRGDTHDDQVDTISGGVEMLVGPNRRIVTW